MDRRKAVNWEIEPEVNKLAGAIAEEYGTTKRAVVELGIRAAKDLIPSHARVAEEFEDDVAALYLRAAKLMPMWLAVRTAVPRRFSGGRPALVVDDGDTRWVLGEDDDRQLMAASWDGRLLGRIVDGEVVVVRDRDLDLSLAAALN